MLSEYPFQLIIKNTYPEGHEESLLCKELLRYLPGKRKVFDAVWNDRDVIVKIFSDKFKAKRHLKREWTGLTNLKNRKLDAPEPLFYGRTENSDWAIVTEKIADSSTALEILEYFDNYNQKIEFLTMICKQLAKQHINGVLQKDLHMENFLLADNKIYTLDPGQITFFEGYVPQNKCISQLAILTLYAPDDNLISRNIIRDEYFKSRGWELNNAIDALFHKQIKIQRNKAIKHALKKCLRSSKRHIRIKTENHVAVFDKSFYQKSEANEFINQLDNFITQEHILKDGNTCFVSRLSWNNHDIVIKRYNHKGFFHSLRHSLKKSRARRVWLNAQKLGMLGIPTAKPLAYIEKKKGFLIWSSYLVTEYMEGSNLYNFLRDESLPEKTRSIITQQLKELLDKLAEHHITHGDLKHSNILITKNGPALTDLDSMRTHRFSWTFKIRRTKDLQHFTQPSQNS